jgi:hypothetical protein
MNYQEGNRQESEEALNTQISIEQGNHNCRKAVSPLLRECEAGKKCGWTMEKARREVSMILCQSAFPCWDKIPK